MLTQPTPPSRRSGFTKESLLHRAANLSKLTRSQEAPPVRLITKRETKLRELFAALDANSDGSVTQLELIKALRRRMVAEHELDTSEGEEEADEEEDEYGGGLCCFGPGETARCPACGEQSEVRIPALQTCTALRLPRAPSNPLAPRQAKLACVELDCAVRLAHITQEQHHTYMLRPSRTVSCVRPTAHLMPLRPAAKS